MSHALGRPTDNYYVKVTNKPHWTLCTLSLYSSVLEFHFRTATSVFKNYTHIPPNDSVSVKWRRLAWKGTKRELMVCLKTNCPLLFKKREKNYNLSQSLQFGIEMTSSQSLQRAYTSAFAVYSGRRYGRMQATTAGPATRYFTMTYTASPFG
jgi:hypothetical protein